VRPSILLTDLYELTMLQAYHAEGMNARAAFEFFVRSLPANRNFLVAAGLAEVLDYLSALRFEEDELDWLRRSGRFTKDFIESLRGFRFTGDVDAMPEGTPFFTDEPILRITAPLKEAQLVESRVMNLLHFETLVASKAIRCALAAPDRLLVDFGLRRAHGAEAALLSARASYLAGFSGSATVEAGRRFGIPIYGTMAHSYVQAHESETAAFAAFVEAFPGNAMLLIDTYDVARAAERVAALARTLAPRGVAIKGVRLDSGDLAQDARRVRAILDAGGAPQVTIFASGNLDEYRLRDLVGSGAPIDGFGVGTRMNTSADAPFLDCAYKLQEYDGRPRRKRSAGKATWPGRKQVYRSYSADGCARGDVLTLEGESPAGTPLLRPVMRGGQRAGDTPSLEASRAHARESMRTLPAHLAALSPASPYPVTIDGTLRALADRLDAAN